MNPMPDDFREGLQQLLVAIDALEERIPDDAVRTYFLDEMHTIHLSVHRMIQVLETLRAKE